MSGIVAEIVAEIIQERIRQHDKWGEQNHPNGTGPETYALADMDARTFTELGEAESIELRAVATLATDANTRRGTVTWKDILLEELFEALAESDPEKLRAELIQVAAVSAQWIEAIDRAAARRPCTAIVGCIKVDRHTNKCTVLG